MTENPQLPVPRRRGAPRGNSNARKHGFYARNLPAREAREFTAYEMPDLKQDIMMIRIAMRDVFERRDQAANLQETMLILRTIAFGMSSLARLLRTQAAMGSPSEFQEELSLALKEVWKDMPPRS